MARHHRKQNFFISEITLTVQDLTPKTAIKINMQRMNGHCFFNCNLKAYASNLHD